MDNDVSVHITVLHVCGDTPACRGDGEDRAPIGRKRNSDVSREADNDSVFSDDSRAACKCSIFHHCRRRYRSILRKSWPDWSESPSLFRRDHNDGTRSGVPSQEHKWGTSESDASFLKDNNTHTHTLDNRHLNIYIVYELHGGAAVSIANWQQEYCEFDSEPGALRVPFACSPCNCAKPANGNMKTSSRQVRWHVVFGQRKREKDENITTIFGSKQTKTNVNFANVVLQITAYWLPTI